MPKNTKKTTGWNGVRRVLGAWDRPALLGLIKDLYAASEIGRDLVDSRCRPGESDDAILEKYRARIVQQFYPARGDGQLKLGEARRAVREYRKATGSIPGTAELLMTYVETGVRFTCEFGDIDEPFYNSIESALDELSGIFWQEDHDLYPRFAQRLAQIETDTDGIGWGFHDYITDVVAELDAEFGTGDNASSE